MYHSQLQRYNLKLRYRLWVIVEIVLTNLFIEVTKLLVNTGLVYPILLDFQIQD